jgi:hypothetical protein
MADFHIVPGAVGGGMKRLRSPAKTKICFQCNHACQTDLGQRRKSSKLLFTGQMIAAKMMAANEIQLAANSGRRLID